MSDAIPAFTRAIEAKRLEPQAIVRNLHAGLADCLARSGREAEAEREFQAELAEIPGRRKGASALRRCCAHKAATPRPAPSSPVW